MIERQIKANDVSICNAFSMAMAIVVAVVHVLRRFAMISTMVLVTST